MFSLESLETIINIYHNKAFLFVHTGIEIQNMATNNQENWIIFLIMEFELIITSNNVEPPQHPAEHPIFLPLSPLPYFAAHLQKGGAPRMHWRHKWVKNGWSEWQSGSFSIFSKIQHWVMAQAVYRLKKKNINTTSPILAAPSTSTFGVLSQK